MSLWITNEARPFGLSSSKAIVLRLWQSAWPAALAVVIGVAGFALWFAVDPNPAAVWREFVIGENFSTKFNDNSGSILAFWLSPLLNAGLLFPLVIGLLVAALQAIRDKASQASSSEKILWLWVLCWLLVFTLPSQRSARYVIPMMPAIAVLIALSADRIHRVWWILTLGLIATATAALGWIAWCLDGSFAAGVGYSNMYFAALGLLLASCGLGLVQAKWRMACTASSAVAWLALLGALATPFDAPSNQYSVAVRAQFADQKILVPQNFNAQFERYQFILPTSQPMPYEASRGLPASFVKDDVVASRLVLRSRHAAGEVTLHKLSTRAGVQELLVEREVVVKNGKVLIGTKN
jgi:hypothetical protein